MATVTGTLELKDDNAEPTKDTFFQSFTRSCKEETLKPITGKVTGKIPEWLKGSLVRNGAGLTEVGSDKYKHAFDGLALMHRFCIKDGVATYQNVFLRSNTYNRNMKANRIVVSEFGTLSFPDPCQTLYQRLMSHFTMGDFTDNDSVNVLKIGDEYYVATETKFIHRIDSETLETKEKVDISKYVAVHAATAHPHYEADGTVINTGSIYFGKPKYCIIKFPPKTGEKSSFDAASILCSIPSSRALAPSYFHSFAMSTNYCVFIEQPLVLSLSKIGFTLFGRTSYADALIWLPQQMVKFHVVRKDTGEILPIKLEAKPFFFFHQINCFEEEDCLVMDICCYEDGSIIRELYLEELRKKQSALGTIGAQARRYVLPLSVNQFDDSKDNPKKIDFKDTKATAVLQSDNTILCSPEVLTEGIQFVELPQINYEKYNGKKYQYFYAVCREDLNLPNGLIKGDVQTGKHVFWKEENKIPSEPVFVPSPTGSAEDDGVILSSLLHIDDETKVTLLINDSKGFQEIARIEFETSAAVPHDFHGMFIP